MNTKPFNITILGPSGGGKGTQAKKLSKKFGWKHISMGKLLRQEVDSNTTLGRRIKKYVRQGEWVPDEITMKVLEPELKEYLETGFILDGFPRAPTQPKLLGQFLAENDRQLDLAVHIDIRPKVIMARRKKAWEKGKSFYDKQRQDETLSAIKSRIEAYQKTIEPILEYYEKKGLLFRVDGERPIDAIFQDIVRQIKARLQKE